MILYDTEKKRVINDAVELLPGIWVHRDNRHICTDTQVGELGSGKRYALLPCDSSIVVPSLDHDNIPAQNGCPLANKKGNLMSDKRKVQRAHASNAAGNRRAELETTLKPTIKQNNQEETVVLPAWINEWLKGKDAFYEVDRRKVLDGRQLNDYGIQWYLGSYFPKSFAEAYIIFSDLFSHSSYHKHIESKEEIFVLDIGCGTGGDTIGLITAIITSLKRIKKINVLACDYCQNALCSLSELIDYFNLELGQQVVEINLTTRTTAFAPRNAEEKISLEDFARSLSGQNFDVILSFKMFNELIRNANFDIKSVYSDFARFFCPLLSDVGTITIEDVSDKVNRIYLSKPLSQSINSFIRTPEGRGYRIISPRPCAIKQSECELTDSYCYNQRLLRVCYEIKHILPDKEPPRLSDGHVKTDIDTLITYRILAKEKMATVMGLNRPINYRYQKVYKRADARSESDSDHYCGVGDGEIRNAFEIGD